MPIAPTPVPGGGELRLVCRLPQATLPVASGMLLTAADGDVAAGVNGTALGTPLPNVPLNIFPVPTGEQEMADREQPRQQCRSFHVPGDLLRAGENEIAITNEEATEITVKRADVGLWPAASPTPRAR